MTECNKPITEWIVDRAIARAESMLRTHEPTVVECYLRDECQFQPAVVKAIMYDLTRLEKYVWRDEG